MPASQSYGQPVTIRCLYTQAVTLEDIRGDFDHCFYHDLTCHTPRHEDHFIRHDITEIKLESYADFYLNIHSEESL